jgi:hypothetical protein
MHWALQQFADHGFASLSDCKSANEGGGKRGTKGTPQSWHSQ